MIKNGTMTYSSPSTGGGIDENGDAIPVTEGLEVSVPCLINPNTKGNLQKFEGGNFITASYEVLLEEEVSPAQIKLTDNRNVVLGSFSVLPQNIRFLKLVNRTKILV